MSETHAPPPDGRPLAVPACGELAYVLAEFPSLSETFILREVLEVLRRGVPLRIYALRRPASDLMHAEAAGVADQVTYRSRPGSRACAAAHAREFSLAPARYVRLVSQALGEGRAHPVRIRHRLVALDAAVSFADLLRRRTTRHIHAHFAGVPATVARYAAALTGASFSFSAHARDIYVDGARDPAGLAANLHAATFVVTCTGHNRAHLQRLLPQASQAKVHCIYHGLDPERFAVTGSRGSGPIRILSVARLQAKKGLSVLLMACARLLQSGRDFEVLIVGDGPERQALALLAQRLGLSDRVRLLGAMTQEQLLPLYGSADIVALPCVVSPDGDRDGIPNVLLEAMAAGIPVVTTALSSIPELVADGHTGLLVPPGDPVSLANALDRLIADPELRHRLGKAGRERVRRDFDIRRTPLVDLFAREVGIGASAHPAER